MYKYIYFFLVVIITSTGSYGQGLQSSTPELNIDRLMQLIEETTSLDVDDHCEVPCGIYGDSLRVSLIKEHAKTIEKAMNKINEISKSASPDYNQLIRWVNNKEKHAEEIQHIVAQYFMHQRVKMPNNDLGKKAWVTANTKYHNLLGSLHAIQVYAMKCKQTTDLNQVGNINSAVSDFEEYYFHGHKH